MSDACALSDFKAALFDVDGTLVDSLEVIALGLADGFERYGGRRPSAEELLPMFGTPLLDQVRRMGGDIVSAGQEQERIDYVIARYQAHQHLERPHPAAIETLELCGRAGMKTALVTSKNAREVELFLPRFACSDRVGAVICASDVARPKPYPDCVRLACERLGVEPSEAVMVGDSVHDIRSARAAGAAAIAAAWGSGSRESLLAERPNAIFDTPEQLLEWAQHSLQQTPCPERR